MFLSIICGLSLKNRYNDSIKNVWQHLPNSAAVTRHWQDLLVIYNSYIEIVIYNSYIESILCESLRTK